MKNAGPAQGWGADPAWVDSQSGSGRRLVVAAKCRADSRLAVSDVLFPEVQSQRAAADDGHVLDAAPHLDAFAPAW